MFPEEEVLLFIRPRRWGNAWPGDLQLVDPALGRGDRVGYEPDVFVREILGPGVLDAFRVRA